MVKIDVGFLQFFDDDRNDVIDSRDALFSKFLEVAPQFTGKGTTVGAVWQPHDVGHIDVTTGASFDVNGNDLGLIGYVAKSASSIVGVG